MRPAEKKRLRRREIENEPDYSDSGRVLPFLARKGGLLRFEAGPSDSILAYQDTYSRHNYPKNIGAVKTHSEPGEVAFNVVAGRE